jgi:hypothetical protein
MIDQLETDLRAALAHRASEIPAGAGARLRQIDYHPRSRRVRPPVAFGALAGTAGTVAVVASVVGLGAGASSAFAGWTASPTSASGAQISGADAACEARLASLPGAAADASLTPALTDTRGPFTFVIFTVPSGGSESCISSPTFTAALQSSSSGRGSGAASSSGSVPDTGGGTVGASQTSVLAGQDSGPVAAGSIELETVFTNSRDGQAYTVVEGRTGSEVTGTTLVLADGRQVTASIGNGWFAAWWPGSQSATEADVTTTTGVSTQQLATAAPPAVPGGMGSDARRAGKSRSAR